LSEELRRRYSEEENASEDEFGVVIDSEGTAYGNKSNDLGDGNSSE
jgi:hypothetical protein